VSAPEPETPPVGEEIHLPGPTALPFVCAIGLTMMVIGTTIGPDFIVSIVGLVIFLVTVVKWVGDTRRDISELPEDHAQH
jgi:hypothetical protein